MLSMTAFLLFPLVALLVRLRHGRRPLLVAMFVTAVIVDTDTRWHWLMPEGGAGFFPLGMWAVAVVTTASYMWFPKHPGVRVLQFLATVVATFLASALGGFWIV